MGFRCGIVGLPNAGKSTIFNALTQANATVAPYPFTTVDPNIGKVAVPDERLRALEELLKPKKVTPATLSFVDIAGLIKGASKGEGLGNQFLSYIRDVDAIAHVVRCFVDPEVSHPYGEPDPQRDVETVTLELILSDLELVERRLEKLRKAARVGPQELKKEVELLEELLKWLSEGKLARNFLRDIKDLPKDLPLITIKPYFYIANFSEGGEKYLNKLKEMADREGVPLVEVNAKVELELFELEPEEREQFRKELGLSEGALSKVVKVGYGLLGLVTFYTTANQDLRAWTVRQGTKAQEAAGMIHSDMQKGFIRAEVMRVEDLLALGSEHLVREKGLVRFEGRDYEVQDGDVIFFRFHI